MTAPSTARSRPRLLWLLVSSVGVGVIAENFVLFATPLLVYELTGRASIAGLAFAVEWLPMVAAYPFAGAIADHLGGKRLFILSSALRGGIVVLAFGLLLAQPPWAVPVLIANAALLSMLAAPNRMAVEKLIPTLADGSRLAVAQAAVQNSEVVARTLGPALAAAMVGLTAKEDIILAAGLLFAVSSLPALLLPAEARPQAARPASAIVTDMRHGWTLLLHNRPLMRLALLNCLINLAFAVALASHAVVITGVFELPDAAYGYLNAGAGALGLINLALIPVLLRRWDVYQLGCAGLLMIVAGLLGSGLAGGYLLYAGAFIVASAGVAMFNVFNRTQRIKVLDQRHIGKVMGPFYLLNLLSMPLGGLIVTLFADRHGNQPLIAFSAVLLLVAGPPLIVQAQRGFIRILGQVQQEGT